MHDAGKGSKDRDTSKGAGRATGHGKEVPMCALESWPKDIAKIRNAGVLVAGCSVQHGGIPAVLLGGRFYTSRRVYEFTDFGGGLDVHEHGQPQIGAFREFAEELLGLSEDDAETMAATLWNDLRESLVGGSPLLHKKSYAMFIVPADALVATLQRENCVPKSVVGTSAIDLLLAAAKRNDELTSVALVSIDEFLAGANKDGMVVPLSLRNLDEKDRTPDAISLRRLMLGPEGSVRTCSKVLRTFQHYQQASVATVAAPAVEASLVPQDGGRSASRLDRRCRDVTVGFNAAIETPPVNERQSACAASVAGAVSEVNPFGNSPIRQPFVFDMETGDPDDVLTLMFLGAHPFVELVAVTITPGTEEQVALVRWLLQEMGLAGVRIGAQAWPKNAKMKGSMQGRFYDEFGRLPNGEPVCESADRVLVECCNEFTTLVTGAALHNLGAALQFDGFQLGRWVAQGGFAGEGVVPRELQMDKFVGKKFCQTWNFGGNIPAATDALASSCIGRRVLVSKNVCHRTVYDASWHTALEVAATNAAAANKQNPGRAHTLALIYSVMDRYLRNKPGGKKLHDPLALAVALDESVCTLAEVRMFHTSEGWGSQISPGSDVWISIDYDPEKFQSVLLHPSPAVAWTTQPMLTRHKVLGVSECSGGGGAMGPGKVEGIIVVKGDGGCSTLSKSEKMVLRLADKLRDIRKSERCSADGKALDKRQIAKIASKPDNAAAFLDIVKSLPLSSDVVARVQDVVSELAINAAGMGPS